MTISFVERELRIDGLTHVLEFPIDDAFEHEDLVIVFFAPDSNPKKFGQFHNVVAVDRNGNRVWEADLPTSNTGDRYYKIANRSPLTLYSTQSYDVVLDPASGHIIEKRFTR
jgi:hypothetical protein